MYKSPVLKNLKLGGETKKILIQNDAILERDLEVRLEELNEELKRKRQELVDLKREQFILKENTEMELEEIRKRSMLQLEEEQAQRIKVGKEMYDEIVNKKEEDKERIERETIEMRERLIQEANQQRESIIAESKKAGFDEGLAQGLVEGRRQSEYIRKKMERIVSEIFSRRDALLNELKGDISSIVLNLARKVIKEINVENKETALRIVRDYLDRLKGHGKITIRVNIEDVELMEKSKDTLMKMVEGIDAIDVVSDSRVEEGGCIIESAFTSIDARIESQLARIEDAVTQNKNEW